MFSLYNLFHELIIQIILSLESVFLKLEHNFKNTIGAFQNEEKFIR